MRITCGAHGQMSNLPRQRVPLPRATRPIVPEDFHIQVDWDLGPHENRARERCWSQATAQAPSGPAHRTEGREARGDAPRVGRGMQPVED
jgi:hypothetical protein